MRSIWAALVCLAGGFVAGLGILALQRKDRRRAISAARQRAEAERVRAKAAEDVAVAEARAEPMNTDDRAELARMLDE